ncbi:Spo0E family sporulation regulatory protein-aspartic acid phosphatase [Clostridium lundense]|uniref:Spo0E family sporulation regulatory protein-aspartic acid phosphatase n=1 Tax=Clostridium cadaveris TaxID=1529 RepID=A0A316MC03_9CLOT|nr:Spo0E family sporulation regulatory protein-aspartic acid phosphatase [Clostridium lundense]PWL55824.1 MAG: Spo0E family sporulation regulatory protein-aspartic acid phosphatase [Clostridium cadaveris]
MKKSIEHINNEIENLRIVLNEICASIDDESLTEEILDISRQMDKLIIDYIEEKRKMVKTK